MRNRSEAGWGACFGNGRPDFEFDYTRPIAVADAITRRQRPAHFRCGIIADTHLYDY